MCLVGLTARTGFEYGLTGHKKQRVKEHDAGTRTVLSMTTQVEAKEEEVRVASWLVLLDRRERTKCKQEEAHAKKSLRCHLILNYDFRAHHQKEDITWLPDLNSSCSPRSHHQSNFYNISDHIPHLYI